MTDFTNILFKFLFRWKSTVIFCFCDVSVSVVTCAQVDQLSTSIRQLESERNQVLDQLREEQHERQSAQAKLQNMQHELATQGLLS